MAHPVDVHIGQRVREFRIAKGMSQTDLANAIGVSFQQVQKYESGANRIGGSRLWLISQSLDVPVDSFFDGLAGSNDRDGERPLSRAAIDLARSVDRISDDTAKLHLVKLAKALAEGTGH